MHRVRRPSDATAQFLEFAETGRLVETPGRSGARAPIALAVGASAAMGAGVALLVAGLTTRGQPLTLIAAALLLTGFCVAAPALRLVREAATVDGLRIRPGAVLAPSLVRKGNWIFRDGAWQRVEQVGTDGGGRIHALLRSGELVELRTPVTVAGDAFRPVQDPLESLRP